MKPLRRYAVEPLRRQIQKPHSYLKGFILKSATTYSPTNAVPSALAGLTSLFGMGRGGSLPL
jgi:hypothetical protein